MQSKKDDFENELLPILGITALVGTLVSLFVLGSDQHEKITNSSRTTEKLNTEDATTTAIAPSELNVSGEDSNLIDTLES